MLIRGDRLNENQVRQVLNAFIYRWTYENDRLPEVYANIRKPSMPSYPRQGVDYFTRFSFYQGWFTAYG